jgi:uncharacterized protein YjbJ (UPF0337 family)
VDRDKVEGKAKEYEGRITGDESREAEGHGQQVLGNAKDKARDALDKVEGGDGD